MSISREEVKRRRAELVAKAADLRRQLAHVHVDFQHLYLDCGHPNARGYTDRSGTSCSTCDDCGWDN